MRVLMIARLISANRNAAKWSAERIRNEFSEFDVNTDGPIFFTGEMVIFSPRVSPLSVLTCVQVYPWMFEDYSELRKVQAVAEKIAADSDWPALFDEKQLAKNEVPVYAAAYMEDMYVPYDLAAETASKIKGCKVFTTNVMYHNAVSMRMDEILRQLFALRDDVLD